MSLQPRLHAAKMIMPTVWVISPDVKTNIEVDVELWKPVGLCIHEYYRVDDSSGLPRQWNISHYESGRFVVQFLKSRIEAIMIMMRIHDHILDDWRISLEQLYKKENYKMVRKKLFDLRKELNDVTNVSQGKRKSVYKNGNRMQLPPRHT